MYCCCFISKTFCFKKLISILPSLLYFNPLIKELTLFNEKLFVHNKNEIVNSINGIFKIFTSSIIISLILVPYF